jgi:hypothetical protein
VAKRNITPFKPFESRSPNGNEKGYIRLTRSIYQSDALKDLNHLAKDIYIDMLFEAIGRDTITYTQKKAKDNLDVSKGGYTNSIKQLLKVGCIERLPRGCYEPSTYKFSKKWHDYKSERRDAFTGEINKKSRLNNSPLKSII